MVKGLITVKYICPDENKLRMFFSLSSEKYCHDKVLSMKPNCRHGMRLLRDHVEVRFCFSKLGPEPKDVEDSKMEWETRLADNLRQQEEEKTGEVILLLPAQM